MPNHTVVLLYACQDTFHDQLLEDSRFLKSDRRLDTELVDKLILQLNRIYPQILSDKEATKVSLHRSETSTESQLGNIKPYFHKQLSKYSIHCQNQ